MPTQTHERTSLPYNDPPLSDLSDCERRALVACRRLRSRNGKPSSRALAGACGFDLTLAARLIRSLGERGLIGRASRADRMAPPPEIEARCAAVRAEWSPERFAMAMPPDADHELIGLLRRAGA